MAIKITVPEMRKYDANCYNERMRWCEENIGERYSDWSSLISTDDNSMVDYFFEKEEHAILFALKWL